MSNHPIIFSAPMVRALLAGRKTMTRRLAWGAANGNARVGDVLVTSGPSPTGGNIPTLIRPSPWQRVKRGNRLWVRESLKNSQAGWTYTADERLIEMSPRDPRVSALIAWAHHKEGDSATSIHMPRWASRLTLTITATKIERLQDINNPDAIAEGCGVDVWHPHPEVTREPFPVEAFKELWIALHGYDTWDANPEVVALTFAVHKQNIDAMPKAEAA